MPYTHKLSRRLALLFAVVVTAGCSDAPTKAAEETVVRPSSMDPALAVSSSSAVGQRVRADRYVQVFPVGSRTATSIGYQATGALGTVLEGPSPLTSTNPYPLFRVNFDSGTDGWVFGSFISLTSIAPPPPPPPPTPAPVASVSLSPSSATLAIGASTTLIATLRDSAGNTLTGRTVTWQSAVATTATVSATGTVTGIAAGSSVVTVASEGRSATAAITVSAPAPSPVASISLAPSTATLAIGASATLVATLRDAAGTILTGRTIAWTSSVAGVATVSATGTVTGIAAGSSVVTVASEGRSATAAITVSPPAPAPVASISLAPSTATLAIGASVTLVPTLRDAAGTILTGRTIAWTTSLAGVATVSASGTVTAIAAGGAIVTATSEGRSATASITVNAPVPPPPTNQTIFASRWLTATGTSSTAFLDASNATPWGFVCCNSNNNTSIVTAASLGLQGWPAGNVYRVGTQASLQNAINTHVIQADIGSPAANSHRYFRYYLQVPYGDNHGVASESNIEHGVETTSTTNSGGRGMNFYRIPRNDGTWFPGYREISSGVRYIGSDLRLLKNHTYRMEWHLAYGVSTYRVEVRIYDQGGVLVATENDFFQLAPSRNTGSRLGAYAFTYTATDHRYFRVGINGPNGNFPMQNMTNDNLFLHGAVAVCSTGWCGAAAP